MTASKFHSSGWICFRVTAVGAFALGVPTVIGGLVALWSDPETLRMPLAAGVIGVATVVSGISVAQRRNWGRVLFMVTAPLASVVLAAVFPECLWEREIPSTFLATFIYVPLSFFLTRNATLSSCGIEHSTWKSRGGWVLLGCTAILVAARWWVASLEPADTVSGIAICAQRPALLDAHDRCLALCRVLLWNYAGALVAVSIPPRRSAVQKYVNIEKLA